MKATVLTGTGGVEKLKFVEIDLVNPTGNEAQLKVLYCGLNHLDLLIRQGKRLGPKKFPHILGSEIVGETTLGKKVVVYPWSFCGSCKQCQAGFENICDFGGTVGRTNWGGYAQLTNVPKTNLIKIPKELDLEKVCASALAGTTAYHLVQRAKIKNKSIVLVTGATGGVGTIVLQLLKNKDCHIICASSHKNKAALLKELGADYIVSIKQISDVTKFYPGGVDYVIDLVGGTVWSQAIEVLAKNGTIIFCATTLDELGQINIGSVFARQLNILGSYGGTIKDLKAVLQLLKKGVINPTVDSVYSLKDVARAHQKLESQKVFGKILIKTN